MKKDMFTVKEVQQMIKEGKRLLLAGDEKLLAQLPKGKWIGGTIPYFMSCEGGMCSVDKIFVNELPSYIKKAKIKRYSTKDIHSVYNDAPENGFSVIIVPALSDVYMSFIMNVPTYENFATRPLVGWMSGTLAENFGKIPAKVFDGGNAEGLANDAVVYHIELPHSKRAEIDIVNIFKPGSGDTIEFLENGMAAKDVLINGKKTNFADYMINNKVDVKMPVVADMYGATINTSLKDIDASARVVNFYAPYFKGFKYKLAVPVDDYVERFNAQLPKGKEDTIFFSCNCFLNYVYGGMEGKKTNGVAGPVTFGEIAYQFLNQTLVYLMIYDQK